MNTGKSFNFSWLLANYACEWVQRYTLEQYCMLCVGACPNKQLLQKVKCPNYTSFSAMFATEEKYKLYKGWNFCNSQ